MPASDIENLPEPLEQAAAVFRDALSQLPPVTGEMLAQRAAHFAAGVRLSVDAPGAMQRLHLATGSLRGVSSLSTLLPRILDTALSLTQADFGIVQLLDPGTGTLRIVTHSGFNRRFLDYFAVVDDAHSACGRAARDGTQTVIADVHTDPDFAPHRGIAAASGFRSVQSTPLVDYAGRLVGMVSTHFRRPRRPPDLNLRIMELYADFAGEAVARCLAVPGDDSRADPISQAVIAALLDPGDGQVVSAIVVPGPQSGQGDRGPGPVQETDVPEGTLSQFTGDIVNKLFSVGLKLESARSITGRGPADERIAEAAGEIDHLIREIRTTLFGLTADQAARADRLSS